MNPWISIWTKPKATMNEIVAENPNRSLWALAWIYGFCSLMNLFQSMALGNSMGMAGIFILAALFAPFWGYINFSVWSYLVFIVGKCLKGRGSFKAVRAAYAWSVVPIIINVPLWLLMAVLFGHQLFVNFQTVVMTQAQTFFVFCLFVLKVVLSVWSLVIYLNGLAAVQSFSVLRSISNVVLSGIAFMLLVFLLWNVLVLVVGQGPAAIFINN